MCLFRMNKKIPKEQFPEPQLQRSRWQNLNGNWQFEIDYGISGFDRCFFERESLNGNIVVPFCPESKLSGVEHKDFMPCVWYMRSFELGSEWLENNRKVILHFGACDYETHLYINKKEVGIHYGGFSSFKFDITKFVEPGQNTVTVGVIDDNRSPLQGTGKQSRQYQSKRCHYSRVTGIWQTVWLESVAEKHIEEFKINTSAVDGTATVSGKANGTGTVTAEAFFNGQSMGTATASVASGHFDLKLQLAEKHLWDVGQGNLYDLKLTYGEDSIQSYFGLRDIHFDGMKFMLNGRSVFQRTVLDQGYYPDGIYTAPDEEALIRDIEISMAAGFNGARLHQRVFEPRFLYHCDRLGYLVWGEYGDWGIDYSNIAILGKFVPEWLEILKRDYNHPALVGWCPFNENWNYDGWKHGDPDIYKVVYHVTKAFDETRPVIDTSGGMHVITDIFDHHDYNQDPVTFKAAYDAIGEKGEPEIPPFWSNRQTYEGQPFFMSEYGGIGWSLKGTGWGYRNVDNAEDFHRGYKGLTEALLQNPNVFGFCYTQLYDVEQEENGLYLYDRTPKADIDFIRKVNIQPAAIEQEGEN